MDGHKSLSCHFGSSTWLHRPGGQEMHSDAEAPASVCTVQPQRPAADSVSRRAGCRSQCGHARRGRQEGSGHFGLLASPCEFRRP